MMGDRAVGEGLKCLQCNTVCKSIGCQNDKSTNHSKKPTTEACHNNSENLFTLYAIASSELTSSSLIKRLPLILTENKE